METFTSLTQPWERAPLAGRKLGWKSAERSEGSESCRDEGARREAARWAEAAAPRASWRPRPAPPLRPGTRHRALHSEPETCKAREVRPRARHPQAPPLCPPGARTGRSGLSPPHPASLTILNPQFLPLSSSSLCGYKWLLWALSKTARSLPFLRSRSKSCDSNLNLNGDFGT